MNNGEQVDLEADPLVTTVVGSYPQPNWLIDRERLAERLPPRVRARELWLVPEPFLEEAQDDATRLAVQDMERAGVDVITDGEMRRESYSNRFAPALEDEPLLVAVRSKLVAHHRASAGALRNLWRARHRCVPPIA